MVQLSHIHDLNLEQIQELLSIIAAGYPMEALGEEMQFLTQAFEGRAVGFLLLDFNSDAFFRNLQRAAHARRFFLRKSREQGSADTVFVALSRTDALFDCIVGGDWSVATDIQNLSPGSWMTEGEYPENYCYHGLIHAYLAGVGGWGQPNLAHDWLGRLEEAVATVRDSNLDVARLELCTSFLAGREEPFWRAFEVLVGVSGDAAAVPIPDARISEFPWVAAGQYVSVELLAWIALARARGFRPPQTDYHRCPSVAWTHGRIDLEPDLFLDLEPLIGADRGGGQNAS